MSDHHHHHRTAAPRAIVPLNDTTEMVLDVGELIRQSENRVQQTKLWRLDARLANWLVCALMLPPIVAVVGLLHFAPTSLSDVEILGWLQMAGAAAQLCAPVLLSAHHRSRHYVPRLMFVAALAAMIYALVFFVMWLAVLGDAVAEHSELVWLLCFTLPLAFNVGAHAWLLVARASLLSLAHEWAITQSIVKGSTLLNTSLAMGAPARAAVKKTE